MRREEDGEDQPFGGAGGSGGDASGSGFVLVLMLVVVQPRPAGATFPGPNGKIAYMVLNDSGIYTINPGGGGKTKVAVGQEPSYSPDGERIAYECYKALGTDDGEDFDSEICTINVGGGGKSQVTNTTNSLAGSPSWGRRP
jgi:hypothetical protein